MQTHLKGFGLENFRVFKDYTWFDFAPITILTGPNSSGKSSLNKALLLLRDNFEKGNLPPTFTPVLDRPSESSETFFFNGIEFDKNTFGSVTIYDSENNESYIVTHEPSSIVFDSSIHNLNDASQLINHSSDSINFVFDIPYSITAYKYSSIEEFYSSISDIQTKFPEFYKNKNITNFDKSINNSQMLVELLKNDETIDLLDLKNTNKKKSYQHPILYRLSYKLNESIAKATTKIELLNFKKELILSISDQVIYFDPCLLESIVDDGSFLISSLLNDEIQKQEVFLENSLREWIDLNSINPDFNNSIYEKIISKLEINKYENDKIEIKQIKNIFDSIGYLSPSYSRQKRSYSEDDSSILKKTMAELSSYQLKGFTFEKYFADCLSLFGIKGYLSIKYNIEQETYFPNIDGVSLVNFGYGYYRLIELVFTIASHGAKKYIRTDSGGYVYREESSMIILEEPEANLHPKYQSMLADLLIDAAETFQIQFIVETHSEYLIRKLQYLTAKKTMKPEDSILYYFHDPNNVPIGEKQVKKIEILDDGSLSSDFGPGFFDEATNWELELLRLKNSKNRQN